MKDADATFIQHLCTHLEFILHTGSVHRSERPRPRLLPPIARGSSKRVREREREREGGSDGAAVDDPGVRGGGGGGGGRAAHAPGAARRAGPDRRAHVDAPAALRGRAPLRRLPAPRYLLEERAQADLHIRSLHSRGACPLREIHF